MTDDTTQAVNPDTQAAAGQKQETEQPKTLSLEDALAALDKARKEAADYRVKYRDASTQAADAEKARKEATEKELAERGQFQTLYEQERTRAEQLAAQAAELQETLRARELALLRQQVASAKKLPPPLADRLRGETQEELEADADALLLAIPRQVAPSLDGRAGGNSGGSVAVTDEQVKAFAARFNINPDYVDRAEVAKAYNVR